MLKTWKKIIPVLQRRQKMLLMFKLFEQKKKENME